MQRVFTEPTIEISLWSLFIYTHYSLFMKLMKVPAEIGIETLDNNLGLVQRLFAKQGQ